MNTAFPPVHSHPPSEVHEAGRVTVTLPVADAPLSLADRASLRLALWLLLRAGRPRPNTPRPASADLARDTARELARYELLRPLR